jgi:hypothetical protein
MGAVKTQYHPNQFFTERTERMTQLVAGTKQIQKIKA